MTFDELQKLVVGIWLEDGPDLDDDQTDYKFKSFLKGYSHSLPEVDRVKFIEREGGGEGGAEDCESIIQVDGTFYKITYSYRSHYGFDWDYPEVYVVKPVERTVTFYETF